MLLLSFVALSCLAGSPKGGVTCHIPVQNIVSAMEALGKASNAQLNVSPEVANEVVYIDLKDRLMPQVLAAIADATAAEWQQDPRGGFILKRPDWKVKAALNEDYQRRLAVIKAEFKKIQTSLDKSCDEDTLENLAHQYFDLETKLHDKNLDGGQRWQIQVQQHELLNYDPGRRAMARILQDVDPAEVARLPRNGRMTFSFRTQEGQYALGQGTRDAMNLLIPEEITYGSSSLSNYNGDGVQSRLGFGSSYKFAFGQAKWYRGTITPEQLDQLRASTLPPSEARVVVWRGPTGFYMIEADLYDANGRSLLTDRRYIDEPRLGDGFYPNKPDKFKFSASTIAAARLIASAKRQGTLSADDRQKCIDLVRPTLDDPVKNDYLAYGNEEALDQLATDKDRSIVACLPDYSFLAFFGQGTHGFDPNRIIQPKEENVQQYVGEARYAGWQAWERNHLLVMRPWSFAHHWEAKVDRGAMKEYAETIKRDGRIKLDPFVGLLISCGEEARNNCAPYLLSYLVDPVNGQQPMPTLPYRFEYVQFYGSLNALEKAHLNQGETLVFDQLTPYQQDLAQRIVYDDGYRVTGPRIQYQSRYQSASVTGSIGTGTVVRMHNSLKGEEPFAEMFLPVVDDGERPFYRQFGNTPDGGFVNARYSMEPRDRVFLRFVSPDGREVSDVIEEADMGKGTKPVALEDLPDEILNRVKRIVGGVN